MAQLLSSRRVYSFKFMKKLFFFGLLIFFISCNSDFDLELQERINYANDEDGDPVIENIKDNDEVEENFQFGTGGGGFCYGYGDPDANVSDIVLPLIVPIEYDISKYLPEVRSQGKQGSCVAWAAGYYLKSFQENYEDEQNEINSFDNEMSPAYIYNQIKVTDCSGGSVIQHALDTIVSQGIVDWELMLYNENECDTQPDKAQKDLAESNKIENYFYLDPEMVFDQTKAALLMNQPVVIAVTIDRSYFGARDENGEFIYRKFKSGDGGHAMLVVGYDDERNAFKVVNSWGKAWGNEGFVWIDYKAFKEAGDLSSDFPVLCEAWITNDLVEPQLASL